MQLPTLNWIDGLPMNPLCRRGIADTLNIFCKIYQDTSSGSFAMKYMVSHALMDGRGTQQAILLDESPGDISGEHDSYNQFSLGILYVPQGHLILIC